MTWWVVAASFFGAVIGATVPAWVGVRGQRQQARTEWSQRLDRAIAALTSDNPVAREIGKELLAALIDSDLGSAQDRDLARRVMRIDLAVRRVESAVDEVRGSGDTGSDQVEEGR